MSTFRIRLTSEELLTIHDVFLDLKDNWLIFRDLISLGPERLRVNGDHVRYVHKLDEDEDEVGS